ncbi:MAG: CDP-alcohol phosphatidyltransferase family protein [Candidatus Aminicenantia bacterium]
MNQPRKTFFTLANQLTLLRMLLIPGFLLFIAYQKINLAFYVFILAGITDALDGLVARIWRQRTTIGTFLDPMADKLLLVSSFIVLSIPSISRPNFIPLWLTIIVISRDVLIVVSALIIHLATGKRNFNPSFFGKLSTIFQVITVFFVLLNNYLVRQPSYLKLIFLTTLFFTLFSGLHYMYLTFQWISKSQQN